MSHVPSHYVSVRVDDKLCQVPKGVATDIRAAIKPYGEFTYPAEQPVTPSGNKALKKAQGKIKSLLGEIVGLQAELQKAGDKIKELRAGGDSNP